MNDRELLELAAKAAGYEVVERHDFNGLIINVPVDQPIKKGGIYWNPLTDDGDALRLSVLLSVDISHNDCQDNNLYVCVHRKGIEMCYGPIKIIEEFEDEEHRLYATRRAIVRAAAAIGKEMT